MSWKQSMCTPWALHGCHRCMGVSCCAVTCQAVHTAAQLTKSRAWVHMYCCLLLFHCCSLHSRSLPFLYISSKLALPWTFPWPCSRFSRHHSSWNLFICKCPGNSLNITSALRSSIGHPRRTRREMKSSHADSRPRTHLLRQRLVECALWRCSMRLKEEPACT